KKGPTPAEDNVPRLRPIASSTPPAAPDGRPADQPRAFRRLDLPPEEAAWQPAAPLARPVADSTGALPRGTMVAIEKVPVGTGATVTFAAPPDRPDPEPKEPPPIPGPGPILPPAVAMPVAPPVVAPAPPPAPTTPAVTPPAPAPSANPLSLVVQAPDRAALGES